MKLTKRLLTSFTALCMLAVIAIPAGAASKRPAALAVDESQVESIIAIYPDYQAGYVITGQKDRANIIKALNTLDHLPKAKGTPSSTNQKNLYITMTDGSTKYYTGARNVLTCDGKTLSDGLGAADLYKAIDEASKNYTAYAKWMLETDPYNITEMSIRGKSYRISVSDTHRDKILNVTQKCKALPVDFVEQSAKEDSLGINTDYIELRTANSKEEYTIIFEEDGYFTVQLLSQQDYQLTYHCADEALYQELLKIIKAK